MRMDFGRQEVEWRRGGGRGGTCEVSSNGSEVRDRGKDVLPRDLLALLP